MGHLLATVNPGAADMVGGTEATLPGVASTVIYICRPGEGRRGKHEFPAIVMSEPMDGNNAIDLVVVYDDADFGYRERIPMQSAQHDFPAWRYPREAKPPQFSQDSLDEMRARLDEMQTRLDSYEDLRGALFGPYEKPKKSVMEYLADFETKLKALAPKKGK